MTEFIFLTSGPIDYSFASTSLYESICQTSLGLRFPALKKEAEDKIKNKIKKLDIDGRKFNILSASSRQTRETANAVGRILGIHLKVDRRLNAIPFDFKKIMSEEEFKLLGDQAFGIARPRFLKAFFDNKLLESKLSVKRRINAFLKNYLGGGRTILGVSHSFLMMIIKASLIAGEKAFDDYNILVELCQPGKRPFGFLEGFRARITQNLEVKSLKVLK